MQMSSSKLIKVSFVNDVITVGGIMCFTNEIEVFRSRNGIAK